MSSLTAVVLGATGLVGELLVQQLLQDANFSKVRILVRRPVEISHPKLEVEVVDFSNSVEYTNKLGRGDCIFCCVGTTNSKVKGDKNTYRKIDFDIPVNAAKWAKNQGIPNFMLVSSVGANANSSNFYLRMKGEVEREIAAVGLESFHTFRPGMLLGKRKEFRLFESIAKRVMPFLSLWFVGSLKKYRAIRHLDVAKAMIAAAKSGKKGNFIYHYEDMVEVHG